MKRQIAAAFAVTALGLFALGCNNNKTADASMASAPAMNNAKCCCGAKADGTHTVMYDGKKYGVCSQACADQFNKMSDADKKAAVAKMSMKM